MPTKNEIFYVYSGGASNGSPSLSLGGNSSTVKITGGLNNLFDDITPEQAVSGRIDHRCYYIRNTASDDLVNVEIFIKSELLGGAFFSVGVITLDDVQQFTIISSDPPTGGSFDAEYAGNIVTVAHDSDIDVFATNFETALNSISSLSEVEVTGQETASGSDNFVIFTITFTGADGSRNQPLVEGDSESLTGSPGDTFTLTSQKIIEGSPVNTVASSISDATEVPPGVIFSVPTSTSKLAIGDLLAGDEVPIWLKRTVFPNTVEIGEDNVIISITGDSVLLGC
jgi:hypothetical protein